MAVHSAPYGLGQLGWRSRRRPSSFRLWSREGLIGYPYCTGAEVAEIDGWKQVRPVSASFRQGPSTFPARLFTNDQRSELSAVISSSACSLGKFSRVPISTLGVPKGLRTCGSVRTRTGKRLKWLIRKTPWSCRRFHKPMFVRSRMTGTLASDQQWHRIRMTTFACEAAIGLPRSNFCFGSRLCENSKKTRFSGVAKAIPDFPIIDPGSI